MEKNTIFNEISKELEDSIPKLKKGDTAIYRLATARKVVDPQTKKEYQIGIGPSVIPNTAEIFDPHKGDDGETVQIAFIERVRADGTPILGDVVFQSNLAGNMILHGGRSRDERIYKYLELVDWNGSKKGREDKAILFYRVDEGKNLEDELDKSDHYADAIMMLRSMDKAAVEEYLTSKGVGISQFKTMKQMKGYVTKTFINSDPMAFINHKKKNEDQVMINIKKGEDKKVIKHDNARATWLWVENNEEIFSYDKKVGKSGKYASWKDFLSTKNGKIAYDLLLERIA